MTFEIELDLMGKDIETSKKIDEKKLSTSEEGIEFSKSVISLLKSKAKEHNSSSNNRISLIQLKNIYLRGSKGGKEGKTNGFLGLARVNMFLRMSSFGKLDETFVNDTSRLGGNPLEIDLTDNWEPSTKDAEMTGKEVLAHNIDRNFDESDLYFKDEEPLIFADTLRNLL